LLCNKIHPLKVHAYPYRCYRNSETGDNDRIRIIVIICEAARSLEKQYTKRLLPDFIVPNGVIRSDKVLDTLQDKSDPLSIDDLCFLLGCVDSRTARRFINRVHNALERASLALAEKLSHFFQEKHIPLISPDTSLFSSFRALVIAFNKSLVQLHGGKALHLQQKLHYFIGLHWPQNRNKKPSSSASDSTSGLDTS